MRHAYEITGFRDKQEKIAVATWLAEKDLGYDFNTCAAGKAPSLTNVVEERIVAPDMEKAEVEELKVAYPNVYIRRKIGVEVQVLY